MKTRILTVVSSLALCAAAQAPLAAPTLADEDVLEPSIQNEVDHALARAPSLPTPDPSHPAPDPSPDLLAALLGTTNRLSATDLAIRLVSQQKSDGHWYVGTNDVTSLAVTLLTSGAE